MATAAEARNETPDGSVRFWAETNWEGKSWNYNPENGYQDVPAHIHDHASSFYSRLHVEVDAVNWSADVKEVKIIRPNQYEPDWEFGRRLDAVGPTK